ncbi:MAG: HupE/UreJ family protein [Bacteroidota bacterium]
MFSQFKVYFGLGLDHILDVNGYDHILFVIALCAIYTLSDWKRLLILVTAFTIGHSVTLALATLDIVKVNSALIEFLIPVTILITAFSNIIKKPSIGRTKANLNYYYAIFFGLIHGLGFSNYLKSILGKGQNVVVPLLSFNVGIEIGQIIIVVVFMIIAGLATGLFGVTQRDWRIVISSGIAGIALTMILDSGFLF